MESPFFYIGLIVLLLVFLSALAPPVHAWKENITIFSGEESQTSGSGKTYPHIGSFQIREDKSIRMIKLVKVGFDDTGDLFLNGRQSPVWRDTFGCSGGYQYPNTNLLSKAIPGPNTAFASVVDDCGGLESVLAIIEVEYFGLPPLTDPFTPWVKLLSVNVASIHYIGPRLGVQGSIIQVPPASSGFNLTVYNYGESASDNSFISVRITGNYTNEYNITQNFSLGPGGSKEVFIDLSVPDGKYNMSVFFNYTDPETNVSFNYTTVNATLIVGAYSAPNVNLSNVTKLETYQTQNVTRAFNYLVARQNQDGGWGENGSSILTTALVVDAFQEGNSGPSAVEKGLNYLESRLNATESLDLTARMLLPLIRGNRSSPAIDNVILRLKGNATQDMGWAQMEGFEADPMASLNVGRVLGNGTWLLEHQENEVWKVFNQDEIFITAQVLSAMAGKTSTEDTVAFLEGQNMSNLSVAEKAAILEALTRVNKTSFTEQLARNILLDQEADGSFGDVVSTAFAVKSLIFYEFAVLNPRGEFYTVMPSPFFSPGGTFSTTLVVMNTGNDLLEDDLWVTIKDPSGKAVYREWKLLDIRPGDAEVLDIDWAIPSNATAGTYTLTAELYETESFPETRFFEVG